MWSWIVGFFFFFKCDGSTKHVFVYNRKKTFIRYLHHLVDAPEKPRSRLMFNYTGSVLSFRNFGDMRILLPEESPMNTISAFFLNYPNGQFFPFF